MIEYRRVSRAGPGIKYGSVWSGPHWIARYKGGDIAQGRTKIECAEEAGRVLMLRWLRSHGHPIPHTPWNYQLGPEA